MLPARGLGENMCTVYYLISVVLQPKLTVKFIQMIFDKHFNSFPIINNCTPVGFFYLLVDFKQMLF